MESTYDIVFACKTEFINRQIREQKSPFLDFFDCKNGELSARIPEFQIGWAGNEQYMAVDLTLKNVRINWKGIEEQHNTVKSRVQLQFCFKDEENVGFVCRTVAEHEGDVSFGAIWVENADVECVLQNELLQYAFKTILANALIEQEAKIGVVLANLKKTYFQPLGITIFKSVPAFQNLNGIPVMAVMCMTHQTGTDPSRQFSPALLPVYDFGYIMRREIFLEKFLLPRIPQLLNISSGKFNVYMDNSIVNEGTIHLQDVRVAATNYPVRADLLELRFEGDYLHLLVEGTADFTGLSDSYISYTFHAVRQSSFNPENGGKVSFVPIPGVEDEYHSNKHIPLWIEITAGIFTLGLFNLISELIGNEIESKAGNLFKGIHFNGNDGGYFVTWANKSLKFSDGGYADNFYMRGKN